MPVNPALAVSIPADLPFYRITAVSFHTANVAHHRKVVNGMGARKSHAGARYNYGGVLTVYLADSIPTCLAEKMFYFQREVIRRLDVLHLPFSPGVPAFSGIFTLWEIRLKKAIPNVCRLTQTSASAVGVFPSLLVNPSRTMSTSRSEGRFLRAAAIRGSGRPPVDRRRAERSSCCSTIRARMWN